MAKEIQIDNDFELDFLGQEEEQPKNVRPYVKENSFDSIQPKQEKVPTGKKLILRSQQVDRFNVVRTRVELTPSMCQMYNCKYDAASKWGGWQFVPESEKAVVVDVLRKHNELQHTANEELIIDEGMLDGQWLQSAKGI